MQNVGVSWLAATLSASPLMISLIQTASSLPALLFSYPAGVFSDHSDRRKFLIGLQIFLFGVTLVLTVCSWLHWLDIRLLILFTLTHNFYCLNAIMMLTGIGWINATSMLNVLAQQHSPNELKGRFLAVNVTVFQGSIALFSAALVFFPMEETTQVPAQSVACADPLLQYQLK